VPVQVALGDSHTCAITRYGAVKCWGSNSEGQLGLGISTSVNVGDASGELTAASASVQLGTGRYARALALGNAHTCALLDNGAVKCWGANVYGQLGQGTAAAYIGDQASQLGDNLPAVNLGTGLTATAITAGYSHSCALLNNGAVKCWGLNTTGQLGLGDTNARGTSASDMGDNLPAVSLGTGLTALSISASPGHTCAVLSNQTLKCWGYNLWGQLGQTNAALNRGSNAGQMGDALPAISLGTGRTVTGADAGGGFTCAVLDDATVKCFGRNDTSGDLGTVWCENDFDQLGSCSNGQYPTSLSGYGAVSGEMGDALPTVSLASALKVSAVAAGNTHACALLTDGSVKCWGMNDSGQLGQGDVNNRGWDPAVMGNALLPIALGAGRHAVSIKAGNDHTCAVLDDQTIRCWGANEHGELGLGDTLDHGSNPGDMGDGLPAVPFE
jgi:alpha-tubulin suppressor-like RCC1 family protein